MGTVGAFVIAFFIYRILTTESVRMVGLQGVKHIIGGTIALCSSWFGLIFILWFLHWITLK